MFWPRPALVGICGDSAQHRSCDPHASLVTLRFQVAGPSREPQPRSSRRAGSGGRPREAWRARGRGQAGKVRPKQARSGPHSAALSQASEAAAEGYRTPYIYREAQTRSSAAVVTASRTRRRYS